MKKVVAVLLAALVMLLCGALAEAGLVARNGALAAYLDGEGSLYLPGNIDPVNRAEADALVSIDAYRVLFLSNRPDGGQDLYSIDLSDYRQIRLAENVSAACLDGETVYFVPAGNRRQIMRQPLGGSAALAYTAVEPIDRLALTPDGVAAELVDGAGAVVRVELTDSFESWPGALPREHLVMEDYEAFLTADHENAGDSLYLRNRDGFGATLVDSDVLACAAMPDGLYYLARVSGGAQLKGYDPAAMTWKPVLTVKNAHDWSLAATQSQLYMMDAAGQIYTVDIAGGKMNAFAKLNGKDVSGVPAGWQAAEWRLEGMNGQLNAYAVLEEDAGEPDFSFIEFTSTSDLQSQVYRLAKTWVVADETNAWNALRPARRYAPLSRGSRGEAVRAIQQPLYDLGYYDYYVDGIFGPRTDFAVRLLQSDLDRPVNGIADSELQKLLLNGGLSHYDPYAPLTRGSRGLRVQLMQQKLRALGYMADGADGIFGANTQRGVQLFQSENGLKVSEGATRETLKRLYSGSAPRCASYIDLYPGNTGDRVRELNRRLRALYFLESNPGSVYTRETAEAVRRFQRRAGMRVTGNATVDVLRRLFSHRAPEAPGYIELRRGDDNARVRRLQRRLSELNYYDGDADGYFDRATEKAVELFQKRADLKVTGVATVRTQELLFRRGAPEYKKPARLDDLWISPEGSYYYDDGVYYISDRDSAHGYVTFRWVVEGEAENYRVKISDEWGRTYVDQETLMTRTGVSLATLDYDRRYTLTVTAYPEEGSRRGAVEKSVRFVHIEDIEEPGPAAVSDPEITLKTVLRLEDGVHYMAPGLITIRWHAEGEVDCYNVEILDENGDSLLSRQTRDERLTLNSSDLIEGNFYRVFVYAIPVRGTIEEAASDAEYFALESANAETASEPTWEAGDRMPVLSFETVAEVRDGVSYLRDGDVVLHWQSGGDVARYAVVVANGDGEPLADTVTDGQTMTLPRGTLQRDAIYRLTVTPQLADGTVLGDEAIDGFFALYTPEAEAPEPEAASPEGGEGSALSAPELSFEPLVAAENGISYVGDGAVALSWHSEGGAARYEIEITDGAGSVLAQTSAEGETLSIRQGNLKPGEVYTLTVTPVAADEARGPAASARFALYEGETVESEAVPESEETPEPEITPEPEEAPQAGNAALSAPELSFEPLVAAENGVSYVGDGAVALSWHSEGGAARYEIEITDGAGSVLAQTSAEGETLSIRQGNLKPGEVYTLTVTPVAADEARGPAASARFALYAAEAEPEADTAEEEPSGDEPSEERGTQPEDRESDDGDKERTGEAHTRDYEERTGEAPDSGYEEHTDEEGADDEDYGGEESGDDFGDDSEEESADDYDDDSEEESAYDYDDYGGEESADDYDDDGGEESADDYSEEAGSGGYEPSADPESGEAGESTVSDADGTGSGETGSTPGGDWIVGVQQRLVSRGLLAEGSYQPGALDEATLSAVRRFQEQYNATHEEKLTPAQGGIDAATRSALMGG